MNGCEAVLMIGGAWLQVV